MFDEFPYEKADVTMELFLATGPAQYRTLAAKYGWCAADALDEKFYAYLAEGAFHTPLYETLLRFDVLGGIETTAIPYTFQDGRTGQTFGPGSLPPMTRKTLALVENSQRGICTEAPDDLRCWWPKAESTLARNHITLLTAADFDTVERLWFWLDSKTDCAENIPLTVIHNGSYHLLTVRELRNRVEYGQGYHIWADISSLADVLDHYLRGRRPPVFRREYSLPECDSLTQMQSDGWTIRSSIRLLPAGPEGDYDLYEAKYPALLLLSRNAAGRWRADEDCPWRLPSYDELLWGVYGYMNQEKASKVCGLVVNQSLPLTRPEDVLRGPLYGFTADCETKMLELTDGTAAVQRFADTLQNFRI